MATKSTKDKAEDIARRIMVMDSPREAATVLGYAMASLLAQTAASETEAREMMADTVQGVMTYWSALTGIKLAQ